MPKIVVPPFDIFVPRFIEQREPFELGYGIGIGNAKYKVQICREGKVVREPFGDKWFPNLITNNGLDQACQGQAVANGVGGQILSGCRIGTGTTPPAVTDTALVAQTQTTTTILGSGNGTVNDTTNGLATHTRVFEFAAVGAPVGLNELGLTNTGSLCTRALFPATVNLSTGDNLRLVYTMTESVPCTVTPITVSMAAVNGFNPSGQIKAVGTFQNIFSNISAGGSVVGGAAGYEIHYGGTGSCSLYSAPSTFPTVNTQASPTIIASSTGTVAIGSYTAGSFTRNKTITWIPSAPPSTVSNVLWVPLTSGSAGGQDGLILLLSTAQTKANTNTLTITVSITVSRV